MIPMNLIEPMAQSICKIMKLFTTCSAIGWKFKSHRLSIQWTWFMIPMNLIEPMARSIRKIMKLFTTCSEIGWKFKSHRLSIRWTWFMIPMKLVEPIARVVCKIMKLGSRYCEFLLTKEVITETDSCWYYYLLYPLLLFLGHLSMISADNNKKHKYFLFKTKHKKHKKQ